MIPSPLRVAFAGLAHSHPFTDAANVRASGGEVVAVHDADADAAAAFASRFGGSAVGSVDALRDLDPDVVIATPRFDEASPLLRALAMGRTGVPVFFNKVVAATRAQLTEWESAMEAASAPVGTASVLRYAPALTGFAEGLAGEEVLAVRVRAQHDNAGFQLHGRDWQDDPQRGGGTLVTVGVHAWELVHAILPCAELVDGSGWTRSRVGATTRSEDIAGIDAVVEHEGARIAVQTLVSGIPGPDAYGVDVLTASGSHTLDLDADDANTSLGFEGLIAALGSHALEGRVPAPWSDSRHVAANTIRAAEIARGHA